MQNKAGESLNTDASCLHMNFFIPGKPWKKDAVTETLYNRRSKSSNSNFVIAVPSHRV